MGAASDRLLLVHPRPLRAHHRRTQVQRRTGWELLCNLEAARASAAHPSVLVFAELIVVNEDHAAAADAGGTAAAGPTASATSAQLRHKRNLVNIVLYTRQCLLGSVSMMAAGAGASAAADDRRSGRTRPASAPSSAAPRSAKKPFALDGPVPPLYEAKVGSALLESAARAAIGRRGAFVLESVLAILRRRQSILGARRGVLAYVLPLAILEAYLNKPMIDPACAWTAGAASGAGIFTIYQDEVTPGDAAQAHDVAGVRGAGEGEDARRIACARAINERTAKLLEDLRARCAADAAGAASRRHHHHAGAAATDSDVTSTDTESHEVDSDAHTSLLDDIDNMCGEIQSEFGIDEPSSSSGAGAAGRRGRRPPAPARPRPGDPAGVAPDLFNWASSQVQYSLRLQSGEYASLALSAAIQALSHASEMASGSPSSPPPEAAEVINPDMIADMKLQARSMLYKEAVNVLGAVEARVYYDGLRSPGAPAAHGGASAELHALIEEKLVGIARYHPMNPPRKALSHVSKLILSSGAVRDAFEPLVAWLVAYAAELQ